MITSSGNQEVDALWGVNISGNVIPANWYRTIVRESGKAHLLAINILADIVYWFRPVEVRDEATGYLLGLRRKFKGDALQKSYKNYENLFGCSHRLIKEAFDLLVELGVIRREFRQVDDRFGNTMSNVMFIHLNVEVLKQLTFTDRDEANDIGMEEYSTKNDAEEKVSDSDLDLLKVNVDAGTVPHPPENDGYPLKSHHLPTENEGISPTKQGGGTYENRTTSYRKPEGRPAENVGTYTEITTENIPETTGENTPETTTEMSCESPSVTPSLHLSVKESAALTEGQKESQNTGESGDYDSCEALVKQRIEYDWLLERHPENAGILDSICHCMAEIMAVPVRSVRINGGAYPYDAVKARLLKLDVSDIEPLLARLAANTKTVSSSRSYILTALYNARDDNNVQTAARFQHNLAAGAV